MVRPEALEIDTKIIRYERLSRAGSAAFRVASGFSRIDDRNIGDDGTIMRLRKTKSIRHNSKTVAEILEAHERFFRGKDGGARADFTGADLCVAILRETDLSGADLSGVDLSTTLMPKGWAQQTKQKNA